MLWLVVMDRRLSFLGVTDRGHAPVADRHWHSFDWLKNNGLKELLAL